MAMASHKGLKLACKMTRASWYTSLFVMLPCFILRQGVYMLRMFAFIAPLENARMGLEYVQTEGGRQSKQSMNTAGHVE